MLRTVAGAEQGRTGRGAGRLAGGRRQASLLGVDINVAVPLLLTLVVVVAAFIRRWWAVVLPLGAIPLFYAGLRAGWWGDGVGDGWQYAALIVTSVGLLGSALGVAGGRALVRILRH
jgi:hypothetical protein